MPLTVGHFLQSLDGGGLLAKEDFARIEQAWPAERRGEDAKPLAIDLVRQKLLTQFQALNLYHGKAQFLVLGNYILLDILGEGGMGKVYKAVHRRMQRIVALKLLPAALTKETEILRRFQREAQAAARLVHPNIVTAYDADEARGVYFLVMEYVDGQDLGSYLKEHGVLPVALAVDCIIQAARGLEYAHAQGVIHRDVKPSNLLLSGDGVVKVMDLGLARFDQSLVEPENQSGGERPRSASDPRREQTELTRQGQIIGTVSYMAPEQTIEMGLADARSDVYALGCTLYRLLTGDVPYSRDTTEATMTAQREAPIPSLRKFRRDVTSQLDAVLRKMLAKQPTERYQSMAEVIAALKDLSCEAGPAQHVSQKAAGDDFKSDLLSSLMGLGPGVVGALLDNPADQNWNPTDDARARTASHSQTVANPSAAPAHGRPPTEVRKPQPRSFPWSLVGFGAGLLLVGAVVIIYLRAEPSKTDTVASGNPAGKAKKTEPDTEAKPPPEQKAPSGVTTSPEQKTPGEGKAATTTPEPDATKSPPKTTGKVADRPRPADPDRAVAEWLLPYEATLYLALSADKSGSTVEVSKLADLPAAPFTLRGIKLTRMPREIDRFADLRHLQELALFIAEDVPLDDDFLLCLPQTDKLQALSFSRTQITDAGVGYLSTLPNLKQLHLVRNARIASDAYARLPSLPKLYELEIDEDSLGDAAMPHLARIRTLQSMTLTSRKITGTGLKALAGLADLHELKLRSTRITDDDFVTMGEHTGLSSVATTDCPITGAKLDRLVNAPNLQILDLTMTNVEDESLRPLGRFPKIGQLRLDRCRNISDEGLRHISQAVTLYRLWLADCPKVSDEGLQHLHKLSKLVELGVKGTKVTKQGVDALKRALPQCSVAAD